jgi:hypothetical protein
MLPDFIIIGAMKCGTGSLWYYLRAHPEIAMSEVKELNFFIAENNPDRGVFSEGNFGRGIEWYEANFTGDARIYGEASPNYTKYPAVVGVPERMHSVLPDAKLIYVVRDPIERMVSHYVHFCSINKEKRSVSEAFSDLDHNYYLDCSKYYMQLEQFLEYYPRENMLVVTSEGLKDRRRATLKTIFNFLNVDDSHDSPEYSKVVHKSSKRKQKSRVGEYLADMSLTQKAKPLMPAPLVRAAKAVVSSPVERPVLDKAVQQKLIEHLGKDVESLRRFTGNELDDWRL